MRRSRPGRARRRRVLREDASTVESRRRPAAGGGRRARRPAPPPTRRISGKLISAQWDRWRDPRSRPASGGRPRDAPAHRRDVAPGGRRDAQGAASADDGDAPFIVLADPGAVNWSDELEALHEESSRDHFIDVWTRDAMLDALAGSVAPGAAIVDLGCSTGYLLEELRQAFPTARLIGVDLVAGGLRNAHALVPDADALARRRLRPAVRGRQRRCGCVRQPARARSRRPGRAARDRARAATRRLAVLVVPAGPGTYDYYDRFLGHERRYGRGSWPARRACVGLRCCSTPLPRLAALPAVLGREEAQPAPVPTRAERRSARRPDIAAHERLAHRPAACAVEDGCSGTPATSVRNSRYTVVDCRHDEARS